MQTNKNENLNSRKSNNVFHYFTWNCNNYGFILVKYNFNIKMTKMIKKGIM